MHGYFFELKFVFTLYAVNDFEQKYFKSTAARRGWYRKNPGIDCFCRLFYYSNLASWNRT